jgi:hypothetical protein
MMKANSCTFLAASSSRFRFLKQMDAVDDQSDLVDWQRELLVGFGCNLDWPVVSAEVLNRADV